jgi:hypothetical protein
VRANEAYRSAMPPLTTPQNLCDFVACVAHGVAVRTILPAHATSLLDAARVAARAFKFVEGTSAPRSAKRKNKIPGCETVDWDFVAVKTMHYERAPVLQKEAFVAGATCRGFAPAPPGFSALVPLPIRTLCEQIAEGGCRSIPPGSVEATESALGLPPGIALPSAQSGLILLRRMRGRWARKG